METTNTQLRKSLIGIKSFYSCQTESTKRDADWFNYYFQELGFEGVNGIHLRRIHYKMISQEKPIVMPNNEPYQNTEPCWKYLTSAAKHARYGGMIDLAAFDDRRNPDPLICLQKTSETSETEEIFIHNELTIDRPSLPKFPDLPYFDAELAKPQQRYHLEIWCEKSTMNDVLSPICQRYRANLQTGLGEMSLTMCSQLAERIERNKMPCRVFYISDFDPAGKSMPVAVSRKLEWLLKKRNIEADVQVFQIALQQIQVEDLRLPRTPIKETEARRDKFEARYGQDAVELDAIEAIHPGQLASIVRSALDPYYDHELARRFNLRNSAIERELEAISDEVYDRPELTALQEKWEELTKRYDDDFASLLDEISETFKSIKDELEQRKPDLAEWEHPKPKEFQGTERAIFDSSRDYLSQIEAYKRFQSGDEILDYEPIPHSHQMSLGLG